MKPLLLVISLLICSEFLKCQDFPHVIRTPYQTVSLGSTSKGDLASITPKPVCIDWYLDYIKQGYIPNGSCGSLSFDKFIIGSSEPIKFEQDKWSIRYFGYDPLHMSYMKDGSLIDDVALTLIYDGTKYSVLYVISGVDPDTAETNSGAAITYYNP